MAVSRHGAAAAAATAAGDDVCAAREGRNQDTPQQIARLLLACCASEACVERMFSKEGFIQDSYRNRLGNGILLALVRSCMNRHALDDERLELNSESSEALSSDAERE